MSEAFGERFTLMIDLVDVKQKELANCIGVHPSLISKCKKGERQLPRCSFEKIPQALKELGKWHDAYDEPWAELWLMYLQETGADGYVRPKPRHRNKISQYQFVDQSPLFANLPSMPNSFTGSEELVADIVSRLTSDSHVALAAERLPDVGNTTLAVIIISTHANSAAPVDTRSHRD